jgi:energy-converting hydrogenase Eha subunit H
MDKKVFQFVLGIVVALAGAAVMFHGNVFGEEYNTGIAIALGIVGIGMIATSRVRKL